MQGSPLNVILHFSSFLGSRIWKHLRFLLALLHACFCFVFPKCSQLVFQYVLDYFIHTHFLRMSLVAEVQGAQCSCEQIRATQFQLG